MSNIPLALSEKSILFLKNRAKYFGFAKKRNKKLFERWSKNRELAISERNSRKIELTCKPIYVDVELNNTCNLNCLFCHSRSGHGSSRMSKEDIDKLVEIARYAEVIETSKAAEPFSTPDLFEYFLVQLRKINPFCIVHAVSNGHNISDNLLHCVVKYKLDHLYVSINSHDETLYKEICGGDFNRVCGNLAALNEFKEKTGSKEPYLHINCQMSKYADPIEILNMAQKYNVIEVNFVKTLVNKGSSFFNSALQNYMSKEETEKLFDKIHSHAKKVGIHINFVGWETHRRSVSGKTSPEYYPHATKYFNSDLICPTDAPWFRFCTFMYGVSTCCWHAGFSKWSEKSFDEIWNGEYIKKIRILIGNGEYPAGCFCRY